MSRSKNILQPTNLILCVCLTLVYFIFQQTEAMMNLCLFDLLQINFKKIIKKMAVSKSIKTQRTNSPVSMFVRRSPYPRYYCKT
jgi:hypothetical protein